MGSLEHLLWLTRTRAEKDTWACFFRVAPAMEPTPPATPRRSFEDVSRLWS
ncbi:hypothetical protein I553_1646 [Mycobacterium xenopi 4042]|uniref:Uncharacterized protein n=1 Tax=Mycobacterium xenopi 4042 TaxID=1299334 RepID=X8CDZ6_MYCXE|nr:hypothetical protein I553_1646 [Mycobacterium xenopi 4042]